MTIKEKVEQNVVVWLLGTLSVGFASGFGAYRTILAISQPEVVPRETASVRSLVQEWIHLRGIDFDTSADVAQYRVVIRADGIPFSYPGNRVWLENDAKVPDQRFPLPIDIIGHVVEFELFFIDSHGAEFQANGQQPTVARTGPHEGVFQLFRHTAAGSKGSGRPLATLNYEVGRR